MKVRTRFAPSPTGYMHIGNLRTALYNYLFAKHYKGVLILRIEDTDQNREVEGALKVILETLEHTHLEYDEGPYIQSERLSIYKEYAAKLVELGGAHYCFCEEIEDEDPCLNLSKEEIERRINKGEKYTVRQTIPAHQIISFDDEVYGHIEVDSDTLNEGILLKSDGYPTYNFANVVDDHLMGITHVIRGNEYLSSTPKYNLIYDAFGWEKPTYIHLPPVMKDETHKLSKRNGDASYNDLIEQGYLSDAIINYIAMLGCYFGEEEILSMDELIEKFDVNNLSKAPAIFDKDKLEWMNGMYLRKMPLDEYHSLIKKYYTHLEINDELELSKALQPRLNVLNQPNVDKITDFINEIYPFDESLYVHRKMKTNCEKSLIVLKEILPLIDQCDFDETSLVNLFIKYAKDNNLKNGQVMYPIRVALSNKPITPAGAGEIAVILGKEETIRRLNKAIEDIEKTR